MTDTVLPPVDQHRRLAALDPRRCVCVTAPAGAGKTELLSQRVLTLLAGADQPEEILAITFTRKAAAEMHHRIMQALHLAQNDEPQQAHKRLSWQLAKKALERDRQCNWQLLTNPNRLKVQTIDSLCASLTKQMPILANFGAQPQIADNASLYYREAVHNLLEQLESDSPIAEDLMNLLAHVDNDIAKVVRLLMALIERREQWLLYIGVGDKNDAARHALEQTLRQVNIDLISALHGKLLAVAPALIPLLDYAGCNVKREQPQLAISLLAGQTQLPAIDCNVIEQWQAIADVLLTKTGSWRKSVDKRTGFPAQTIDGDKAQAKQLKNELLQLLDELSNDDNLLQTLMQLRHLPSATYDTRQWEVLDSLTRLLPSLVAQLTLVFQQHGEVDYSQMVIAALNALGNGLTPSELALKLDHQLRHILVDEFQDTATTQFTLLERLLEGWQEHNTTNPDNPNTVFIVGDGMQSIYGFRQANVGLFLGARKQGINGLHLHDLPLTVNFRSTPAIVNWVNATFSQAFPLQENLARGAVPFEHASAYKPDENNSHVQVFGFCSDQARQLEAQKTVELVQQSLEHDVNASIAILVRSRSHLLEIIPALSRSGIRWNATDIDPLSNVSSVIDLLSLTKALTNIADRISWTALLRTPWVGLSNSDLHALLSNVAQSNLTSESAHSYQHSVWSALLDNARIERMSRHARERLPAVRDILRQALHNRQRLPLRCWIEGVWLQLGGAGSLLERSDFAAVDDFFDLLEHYQQADTLKAIEEFEQAVQTLYAAPSTEHSALQVMTIHKAKGLEFDTVILPAMARQARSDDKSLLMWREYLSALDSDSSPAGSTEPGLIISTLGVAGAEEDSIYRYLRYEQAQSQALENTRLFYVAATRAVKRLYILFEAQHDEKSGEIKAPAKNSLLSSVWPVIDDVIWHNTPAVVNEQIGLDFDVEAHSVILHRLPANWQVPRWSFNNPLQEYYLEADYQNPANADANNRPIMNNNQLARCVGTVTHQILQQLAADGDQFWISFSEQQRQQWLDQLLHHQGLVDEQWSQARHEICRAINNTVSDEKGQWILSSTHQQSVCEWELLACFPAAIEQRVIDRSFVDNDGVRWVIDYKTSKPSDGESKEAFINREIGQYRNQLTEYASYLSMLAQQQEHSPPIRTALYFTYYPHWQELSI